MREVILFLFAFIFLSTSGFAKEGKIVVLTSLKGEEGKSFWNSDRYAVSRKIEESFRRYSKIPFEKFTFIHEATASDVHRELTDSNNAAVFFIGHGGDSDNGQTMVQNSAIFTSQNVHIQNLFTAFHSELKFLAVISCNSKSIIQKTFAAADIIPGENLILSLFSGKIEISKGIKSALGQFESQVKSLEMKNDSPKLREGLKLKLHRSNGSQESSMVLIKNKVVGFFTGQSTDEEIEIDTPNQDLNGYTFSIVHDSGLSSNDPRLDLGELVLSNHETDCELNPERNRKGEILGKSKQYYKVQCFN